MNAPDGSSGAFVVVELVQTLSGCVFLPLRGGARVSPMPEVVGISLPACVASGADDPANAYQTWSRASPLRLTVSCSLVASVVTRPSRAPSVELVETPPTAGVEIPAPAEMTIVRWVLNTPVKRSGGAPGRGRAFAHCEALAEQSSKGGTGAALLRGSRRNQGGLDKLNQWSRQARPAGGSDRVVVQRASDLGETQPGVDAAAQRRGRQGRGHLGCHGSGRLGEQ